MVNNFHLHKAHKYLEKQRDELVKRLLNNPNRHHELEVTEDDIRRSLDNPFKDYIWDSGYEEFIYEPEKE
jgi:hypothetical protein